MNTRKKTERFDEVYKLLLALLTVMISFAIGFFKETPISELAFHFLALYIFSLFFWCFANFWGSNSTRIEYSMKLLGWFFLVVSLFSAYIRITWQQIELPQPHGAIIGFTSAAIFFLTSFYLRKNVHKHVIIIDSAVVVAFTLVTIIYRPS